jgi:hypothetical protein
MTTTVISVTAQSWQRTGRPIRWAYVIHQPGWWPQVSHYRYRSEAAALTAGRRDVEAHDALVRHASLHRPVDEWCPIEYRLLADDCTYCWWVGDSFVSLLTKVAR